MDRCFHRSLPSMDPKLSRPKRVTRVMHIIGSPTHHHGTLRCGRILSGRLFEPGPRLLRAPVVHRLHFCSRWRCLLFHASAALIALPAWNPAGLAGWPPRCVACSASGPSPVGLASWTAAATSQISEMAVGNWQRATLCRPMGSGGERWPRSRRSSSSGPGWPTGPGCSLRRWSTKGPSPG